MKNKIQRDKRGISIVIGYILLVTVSIAMSILVYQWLKTYVPKEALECPDGTSILAKDISYDCTEGILYITVKNNGLFSINGYFIHASNKSDLEQLAIIDLSENLIKEGDETIYLNSVEFSNLNDNDLAPSGTHPSSFNIAKHGRIYKVEIIPTRIQEVEGKKRFVSCTDAKIEEILTCSETVE
jgi:hypothetical protein